MTADTAPRDLIGKQQSLGDIIALAEQSIQPGTPAKDQTTSRPTATRIRIHKDNLLIAKCEASGIGPGRLFVSIDPLHYPVNSKLTLEFVNNTARVARALLTATVTARSVKGIELKLDPTPAA